MMREENNNMILSPFHSQILILLTMRPRATFFFLRSRACAAKRVGACERARTFFIAQRPRLGPSLRTVWLWVGSLGDVPPPYQAPTSRRGGGGGVIRRVQWITSFIPFDHKRRPRCEMRLLVSGRFHRHSRKEPQPFFYHFATLLQMTRFSPSP